MTRTGRGLLCATLSFWNKLRLCNGGTAEDVICIDMAMMLQVFLLDGLLSALPDPGSTSLYELPNNSADYVGTPPDPLTGDKVAARMRVC